MSSIQLKSEKELEEMHEQTLLSTSTAIDIFKKLRDTFKKLGSSIEVSCQHLKEISEVKFPLNESIISQLMEHLSKQLKNMAIQIEALSSIFYGGKRQVKEFITPLETYQKDSKETYQNMKKQLEKYRKEHEKLISKEEDLRHKLLSLQRSISPLEVQRSQQYQLLRHEQELAKKESEFRYKLLRESQVAFQNKLYDLKQSANQQIQDNTNRAQLLLQHSFREYNYTYQRIAKITSEEFKGRSKSQSRIRDNSNNEQDRSRHPNQDRSSRYNQSNRTDYSNQAEYKSTRSKSSHKIVESHIIMEQPSEKQSINRTPSRLDSQISQKFHGISRIQDQEQNVKSFCSDGLQEQLKSKGKRQNNDYY
ncbi:hypothetical protein pb186bvf_018740 [Paramecium bursaria]